ncbi:MAG: DUF1156 domain-containing protein [Thermoguttaceae bacterium]|nr:DUF1156 domain-containing protein [Thermoguttaceae bacterium]
MFHKKLIEVALPLETINAEAAREKSIRHGHPSTLHLWWARRPLAAARAVIWASLVDDPSSHPELFPTEDAQNKERDRLFTILEGLVKWENLGNSEFLKEARAEILKWTNGAPPALLDPFAGGGAIPLEAQRLGLEAHAHDLNPVAVMINKAMIEIPPRFSGLPPVHPNFHKCQVTQGAAGLAEDVRYYGEWMKEEAARRIGHLYPKIRSGNEELTVIAWIWARTVKCPNPACGCEMPLVRSFTLSQKKGKEAWVEPYFENGKPSFRVHTDGTPEIEGTVNRKGATCACCGANVDFPYIRNEGQNGRIKPVLMAIVAEGTAGRKYLNPSVEHIRIADTNKPDDYPRAEITNNPRDFKTPNYGMKEFSDLFTNRQLTALCTFSDLVEEARKKATADAVAAGLPDDGIGLDDGGHGATAYGQAVGVYLGLAIDRGADAWSSLVSWRNTVQASRNTFSRQALPMVWDFTEVNPFSSSCGNWSEACLGWIYKVLERLDVNISGNAKQLDAQNDCGLRNVMVSTDPPYYDNIGYADLSDFFYVWLRQSLKSTFPQLFRTLQVPKKEELVATPYRFEGNAQKAKTFFEDGMFHTCQRIYEYSREEIPVTIYYAYKQSDSAEEETSRQTASTGWETMLTAIIKAGFTITGTWPMRTERPARTLSIGTNALASSIVLVCRKRPTDAPACTRRNFVNELHRELIPALKKLQSGSIAPVDMAQSAIGPGMAVFSKYSQVFESNGTPMTVRNALAVINQELDNYFSNQDSGLDPVSNFCVTLYTQVGFGEIKFGEADTLARAKNISVEALADQKILFAEKGTVHLQERRDLPKNLSHNQPVWLQTQILTHAMETGGNQACANLLKKAGDTNPESARELAYRLYTIADANGWTNEAYAYNSLIVAWPEIQALRTKSETNDGQLTMNEGFDN